MEDGQQGYAVHTGRTLDLGERRSLRYEAGRACRDTDRRQGALCLYPEQLHHAETGGLPSGAGVPADEQPGRTGARRGVSVLQLPGHQGRTVENRICGC